MTTRDTLRACWCALVIFLACVAGYFGHLPPLAYQVSFKLGTMALGRCDLPMLRNYTLPPAHQTFAMPWNSATCGRCSLAQDVPSWRGHRGNYSRAQVGFHLNLSSQRRNTSLWWRDDYGSALRPLVVSLARPAKPAEPLPQQGGCPALKQLHAAYCPMEAVASTEIDGMRLAAAAAPFGQAPAHSLPIALILSRKTGDRNIFHATRMTDVQSIWCVHQAVQDLTRGRALMANQSVYLVASQRLWRGISSWEASLLNLLLPRWHPESGPRLFGALYRLADHTHGSFAINPAFRQFELDRAPDPLLMQLPAAVRRTLNAWPPPPVKRHVLLLQRAGKLGRQLHGVRTGTLNEIPAELRSRGLEALLSSPVALISHPTCTPTCFLAIIPRYVLALDTSDNSTMLLPRLEP